MDTTCLPFLARGKLWMPNIVSNCHANILHQTAKRSLESIDWLFESPVPFAWKQEAHYQRAVREFESTQKLSHSDKEDSGVVEVKDV